MDTCVLVRTSVRLQSLYVASSTLGTQGWERVMRAVTEARVGELGDSCPAQRGGVQRFRGAGAVEVAPETQFDVLDPAAERHARANF